MEQKYIYIIVAVFVILLLIVLVKKDNYVFDPLYGSDAPTPSQTYKAYFKSVHADPLLSINTARYERACENCNKPMDYLNHPMTPRNCEQCRSFVLGHDIVERGQGVL